LNHFAYTFKRRIRAEVGEIFIEDDLGFPIINFEHARPIQVYTEDDRIEHVGARLAKLKDRFFS